MENQVQEVQAFDRAKEMVRIVRTDPE